MRAPRWFAQLLGVGLVAMLGTCMAACSDDIAASDIAGGSAGTALAGGAGGGGHGGAALGGGGAGGGLNPRFEPLAAAIEQERQQLGATGVAVAVVEGGEVTFAAGFGSKHPEYDDPVLPTTLFRIGSVTKMLTAAGLLQLVDDGSVSLDGPLLDYVPEFDFSADPTWAPSLTIRHLLTHTSAIYDHVEWVVPVDQQQDSALYNYLTGPFEDIGYLMAPPGRMYNYSNPGFDLAGLVIEQVTGVWYRERLRDELFLPLDMARSYLLPDDAIADGDYAVGETPHPTTGEPTLVGPHTFECGWQRPAGYVFSSVLDMAQFVKFLRAGNEAVLSDGLRQAMISPQVDTELFLDRIHYGFGITIVQGRFADATDFYEITLLTHSGGFRGFYAELTYVPELDFGFITLANSDDARFGESFAVALDTLATLPSPATPPDYLMTPAQYADYEGTYVDPAMVGDIIVTRVGNDLTVEMPDLDAASIPYEPLLEPLTHHNFNVTIQGYPIQATFIRDAQDTGEYFRTRLFVGRRQP